MAVIFREGGTVSSLSNRLLVDNVILPHEANKKHLDSHFFEDKPRGFQKKQPPKNHEKNFHNFPAAKTDLLQSKGIQV